MSRFLRIGLWVALIGWVMTGEYAGSFTPLLYLLAHKNIVVIAILCVLGWEIRAAAMDWD